MLCRTGVQSPQDALEHLSELISNTNLSIAGEECPRGIRGGCIVFKVHALRGSKSEPAA